MRSPIRHGVWLAVSLVLTACQTTSDPSKGGFLSGLQGVASGTYDQRLEQKQTQFENAQDQNVQRQREAERLASQQAAVAHQRTEAEKKLVALGAQLDGLQAKLATARKDNSKLKGQIASLQKRITLAQQNPYIPDVEKARQLEALRQEKEKLEIEVEQAVTR